MAWPWQAYREQHPYVDPYVDRILLEQEDGFKRDMSEIQLGFNRDLLAEVGRQTEAIKRLCDRTSNTALTEAFNELRREVRMLIDEQTAPKKVKFKVWVHSKVSKWAMK